MLQIREMLKCFPRSIYLELENVFANMNSESYRALEEIRFRTKRPIILSFGQVEKVISHLITTDEILEILEHICENSIYSYQTQICEGYITINGGHRVGITGSIVLKEGKIININYISSLNIRIAKEVIGCSNKLLQYILDVPNNSVYNTLIISPPGARQNNYVKRHYKKNKYRNGSNPF